MSKILVTGASGHLGRQTVTSLLDRTATENIVALARRPDSLTEFARLGVDVREGDYLDRPSLERAFEGVGKLLLISAPAFTDAITQHRNVIQAAVASGVRHIHYTSIQKPQGSRFTISQVTEWDAHALKTLSESGLDVTILRNGLYLEALLTMGVDPHGPTLRVPAGNKPAALISRRDLADATATILTTDGHAGREYSLANSEAVTMEDIAAIISVLTGHVVTYEDVPIEAFVSRFVMAGVPEPAARFMADWHQAIAAGEFAEATSDVERFIGRKPMSTREYLAELLGMSAT